MAEKDPIKTYDARWEVGDFTPDEESRLLEASLLYARDLGVEAITISRDARNHGSVIMEMAKKMALDGGFHVYLCADPISTPHSYFLSLKVSEKHPRTMGMTITASHNQGSYIGLKLTAPGVEAVGLDSGPSGGFTKIREYYHSAQRLELSAKSSQERLTLINMTDDYIRFGLEHAGVAAGSLDGLSVVIDALHGSAGVELHRALVKAGANVHSFRVIPDGSFPSGTPNPIGKGKMADAIAQAGRMKNCVVIGTDGDGDRLVFGDKEGLFTAGFSSLPILKAMNKWFNNPSCSPEFARSVMYDPKINPCLFKEWDDLGFSFILFRNGHSQIKEHMKKKDILYAIEESGHYYHKIADSHMTMYGENSLITALIFLRWVHLYPEELSSIHALQRQNYTSGEFNFQFEDNSERDLMMEKIAELFSKKGYKIQSQTSDGYSLGGLLVVDGIEIKKENLIMDSDWFSGYFRISTNEKGIIRSFITSGKEALGKKIYSQLNSILGTKGKEIF